MWVKVSLICFLMNFVINRAEIAVLIPARGGSKGVRLKNLQTIAGVSLLKRSIETARSAGFNDITVATDHPLIALEAIKCGVEVFHRSRVTASDWAPSIWVAAEFLSRRQNVDILVLLQVTSPFTHPGHLYGALKLMNGTLPYDCVFSATRSFKLRWKEENDKLYPLNFKIEVRPRRQDWHGELLETGAFYMTRKFLISKGYFQNNK